MVTARNTAFPASKLDGVRALPELVVFTSAEAHYSVSKNAMLMGIGLRNVVKVPTTDDGRMVPTALRTRSADGRASWRLLHLSVHHAPCISKTLTGRLMAEAVSAGRRPFFVNATAGTTVKGAFDSFDEIVP